MADDFSQHEDTKYANWTGKQGSARWLWPAGQQQKKYQQSATEPPLSNASFTIGPYIPFSFEWNMRPEVHGDAVTWGPQSVEDGGWMQKLDNFAGGPQGAGGQERLTSYMDLLGETYDEDGTNKIIDSVAQSLYEDRANSAKVFDSKIEVPGEIASEMMAVDPEILELLKGGTHSKMWEDDYWEHLNDINFSPAAIETILGSGREYLDTSPLTPMGTQVLKTKLSMLQLSGVPKSILDDVIGGEETIDVGSKLISSTLKKMSKKHFGAGGSIQDAVDDTAKEIQDMINGFLKSDDRKSWMRDAYPSWYKKLVPAGLGFDWVQNSFKNWIDSKSPIGRVFYGSSGKMEATKPTTKFKQAGEIRQLLKRTIQTELLKSLVEYGLPGKGSIGGTWYYHVPGPNDTGAVFFLKPSFDGSPLTSLEAQIPIDLSFSVIGAVIPAALEGELLSGSMDAIMFHAGVEAGAWTAEYETKFIARRNTHLGAFALMNILNVDQWDKMDTTTVARVFSDMISQPLMTIKGMGISKNMLTPKIFTDLVQQQLKNFATDKITVKSIQDNLKKAFLETNNVTRAWRNRFIQKAMAHPSHFYHELGGQYGVWSNQKNAINDMMGRGIAAAPVFGFETASINQQQAVRDEIESLKDKWADTTARGRMVEGMLSRNLRVFEDTGQARPWDEFN